ncbi:hypothetical protein J3A83DRAFT_3515316 [Scleroderma citrinum]
MRKREAHTSVRTLKLMLPSLLIASPGNKVLGVVLHIADAGLRRRPSCALVGCASVNYALTRRKGEDEDFGMWKDGLNEKLLFLPRSSRPGKVWTTSRVYGSVRQPAVVTMPIAEAMIAIVDAHIECAQERGKLTSTLPTERSLSHRIDLRTRCVYFFQSMTG